MIVGRAGTTAVSDLPAGHGTTINGMALFWLAFILTRPLGAVGVIR
jgi:uncharacterized membrane-anchored protein